MTRAIKKNEKSLRVVLYHHKNRVKQYEARAIAEIPDSSLSVQAMKMTLSEVVDELADLFTAALRKYNELIRKTYNAFY